MDWITGSIIAGCVLAAVIAVGVRHVASRSPRRFRRYLRTRGVFRIHVGWPADLPAQWVAVTGLEGDVVTCVGGRRVPIGALRAVAVVRKDGQIVDAMGLFLPLPTGVRLEPDMAVADRAALRLEDVEAGTARVEVTFEPGPSPDRVRAIRLRNLGATRVRVLRYASYQGADGIYRLATTTGDFYNADDFHRHYQLGALDGIPAGPTVTDPHDASPPGTLWAFFCRTADGQEFVTGAVVPTASDAPG